MTTSRKILITKIIKQGFGQKVGSELGYSSFDITPTTIEITLDPPIDLTTDEGKEAYNKLQTNLEKMSMNIMEQDIKYYGERYDELRISLEKKKEKVAKFKG